ncbi:glycoside hydrolase family 31 protein [Eisenbergiella sp.]
MFENRDGRLFCRQSGETLLVEAWGENSLRVRSRLMGDIEESSAGLEKRAFERGSVEIRPEGGVIRNGGISAVVTVRDGMFHLAFYNEREELLLEEADTGGALRRRPRHYRALSGESFRLTVCFAANTDEKIYGMGQYQQERMDLQGCVLELAHRNSQASVPFYISNRGYGFFWNNPAVGEVTFGSNEIRWIAESTRQMDYWITAADAPAGLVEAYTGVTGRAPSMPEYGLGLWQSKLRYYSQEEVLRVAGEYHRRKIPVDMFIIDYFHWPKCGDYRFEEEFFPDPAGMVKELKRMGMETMVSVWPQVDLQSENYEEMDREGLLVKSKAGVDIQMVHTGFHRFLDATNPRTREYVWEKCRKNYADLGISAFWLDEAEPEFATYDYDAYRYYAGSVEETGNIYPREFSRLFYEGQAAQGRTQIVNLVRCAWAGSQKYGALVWSGDVSATFEDLRKQICAGLHMGLAGIPWWTTDIGGFQGAYTADERFHELLIRWFQFAAFCPVLRMHGSRLPHREVRAEDGSARRLTGADNEVWSFGEEVCDILVFYIRMRERLRGYLRGLMEEAHEKGSPVIRTMFYEFPADKKCWGLRDQYMFGPDILAAPVVYEGAAEREVYLPEGTDWVNVWDKRTLPGGSLVTVKTPIEQIPLFVRDGSDIDIIG